MVSEGHLPIIPISSPAAENNQVPPEYFIFSFLECGSTKTIGHILYFLEWNLCIIQA